jgi:hypothetical protein
MTYVIKTCPKPGCPGAERSFGSPINHPKEFRFCEYCGAELILDPKAPPAAHQDQSGVLDL